jgi:hypothetical protein
MPIHLSTPVMREIPKTDADRLAYLQFVDEDCQIDVELPSTTLNEQALKYLTGYVAHRFRNKYPFLGTASRDDDNLYIKLTQVAKNHFAFATALLWY